MTTPVLIVSEELDHSLLISADAGPALARRCDWRAATVSDLPSLRADDVVIADSRLTGRELDACCDRLRQGLPVAAWVGDPWSVPNERISLLEEIAASPLGGFLGATPVAGVLGDLLSDRGRDAYHLHPFPYEIWMETVGRRHRSRRLAVYGRTNSVYPARRALLTACRRRVWLRAGLDVLPHPGYPDVGEAVRHRIVGPALIDWLATHRFVFVDPSIYRTELQRYCEVAYAGCVPVGTAPSTFDNDLRALIVPLDAARPEATLLRLATMRSAAVDEHARRYREQLRIKRDPKMLNNELLTWWRRRFG